MTAYIRSNIEPDKAIDSQFSKDIHTTSVAANVITTQAEFDEIEREWNELINKPEVEAHIFQTFEWQRLWWKNFGEDEDNDLHILTVWDDQELVGLAPFYIERTSLFGMHEYKELKFIGSSISDEEAESGFTDDTFSYYLDLVIDPSYQEIVVEEFINYLKRTRTYVDAITIDEFSEESIMLNEVLIKIWQRGWQFDGELKEVSTQIALSDAGEDNWQSNGTYRSHAKNQYSHDDESFRIRKVRSREEIDAAFYDFVGLHQKQRNERGYPGIFVNKKLRNFLREAAQVFADKGKLKMTTALDNTGNCVAVDVSFQFKDRIYNYQKAFDSEDAIKSITNFLIEDAADNGVEYVDLLKDVESNQNGYSKQTTRNLQVSIPGYASTNKVKKSLHHLVRLKNSMKKQVGKEWLVLKSHIRQ